MKAIIFILALTAIATPALAAICNVVTPAAGSTCTSCGAGLAFKSSDKSCSLCANGWKGADTDPLAANTDSTCTAYAATVMGCISGSSATMCTACQAGYYFNTTTCAWCPDGTTKAADADIKTTDQKAQCMTVATDKVLTGCSVYDGAATPKCVLCKTGYFLANGACTACTAGCAACTGAGLTMCSYCSMNYVWTAANTCTMCPNSGTAPAQTAAPAAFQTTDKNCTAATGTSTSKASFIVSAVSVFAAVYALF